MLDIARLPRDADLPSSVLPLWQFESSASGMGHVGSADSNKVMDGDSSHDREGSVTESKDDASRVDSVAILESQAEATADSNDVRSREGHEPCYETGSNCVGRKKSDAILDEISKVDMLFKKQMMDALEPLTSVLRGRKEDEQKHQDKLLAFEERKLVLKREEVQLLNRHGAFSNICNSAIQFKRSMSPANSMGSAAQNGTQHSTADGVPFNVDVGIEKKVVVEKLSSARSSSGDGYLQPPKFSNPLTAYKVSSIGSRPSDDLSEELSFNQLKDQSGGDHGDTASKDKFLPKPDKVVPCPRCDSLDTIFCYYNNYNVNQPRHFCKSCQRYWTAGGTLRNVLVGAGRRLNKHGTGGLRREDCTEDCTLVRSFYSPLGLAFKQSQPKQMAGQSPSMRSPESALSFSQESGITTSSPSYSSHQNGRMPFQSHASSPGFMTSGTEADAVVSSGSASILQLFPPGNGCDIDCSRSSLSGLKPEAPYWTAPHWSQHLESCATYRSSDLPAMTSGWGGKPVARLKIFGKIFDSGPLELVMEPIAQVSQALEVIENVCKIFSTVWVNKNQCKRIADRFSVIGEVLKGMGMDMDFFGCKALDGGGSSNKDYPGFHELLTVLRKGEALVSYYAVWKGIISAVSRTDNREAFLEIHQELDTLDSQFHFDGSDDNYIELASGVERTALLTEDAEKDLKEMPRKLEELVRIDEDPMLTSQKKPDLDLETLQQVVLEKSKPVGEDRKLPTYLGIDLSAVEIRAPVRELVRLSNLDPTNTDGWALVHNGSWLGCEFAVKMFKSGDQSEWHKEQLLKEAGALVELRHPHVIRLVGFGQESERSVFLMEKMDADLRNYMVKKLEPAPKPKPRPFTRSEELDIITQIAKGVYYLHTQQYVHGDLKCTNILVKKSGDYLDVKVADLRNATKLGGIWGEAAFVRLCSMRRPRWTAPEAIKQFGGVEPSPDSLLKSDVYSFAMTCYEVVTGKYPFDGIKDNALLEQIEAGVRPELPGELDDRLRGVITSCWDPDPNNRPNFESICHILDFIRSKQSAMGSSKSSGKDVVLSLLKRIPHVHGAFVGLLGQVRGKEQNANIPAHEPSSWNNQNKGAALQRSSSTISFAEHLRIKPSDLKKQRKVGSGSFATVYAATWLGCTFAVKRFKSQTSDLGELTQELEFLISLRHPYIVQLVGLSVDTDQECMIVMEFMSSNVRELIDSRQRKRKLPSATQVTYPAPQLADVLPFDLHEAVLIIWKIALGMAFLHSRGVMHRDLKSLNVLVQEHPGHIDVKIVDFGLSLYVSKSETHGAYIGVGTGFWRAPEILPTNTADRTSKPNLRAIDVYAFAMTCYEVLTGGIPCSGLRRTDYDAVIGGYRPTLHPDLHPDLKMLIEKCWHTEPEERPDFTYICGELRGIHQALSNSIS